MIMKFKEQEKQQLVNVTVVDWDSLREMKLSLVDKDGHQILSQTETACLMYTVWLLPLELRTHPA